MSITAAKPATTPIPVQLSETEFTAFILPHLSMPKRGPKCKLGYYRVFNLISANGISYDRTQQHQRRSSPMNELTPQEQEALRGLYRSRGFNKTTHDWFGGYFGGWGEEFYH